MKKQYVAMILFIAVSAIFLTVGIYMGEAQSAEIRRIERTIAILDRLEKTTGYKSLGVIDAYAVSQETGCIYDGKAIDERLFAQAGIEYSDNSFDFFIDETDDEVQIFKKIVYKGEQREPILQQEIEAIYLYGML